MNKSDKSPIILIVEDNPLDAQMTCWALATAGYTGKPTVVNDGVEAMALFNLGSRHEGDELPDLIVLDLSLKSLDGPEFLDFIRQTPELVEIKVVILSSSPEHVMKKRAPAANCHLSKSSSLDVYAELGKKILDCYFERPG